MNMEKKESREIRMTRSFKAPIDLMWEVWTNPEHIANWWGPNGFTNTIHTMNFQEGGEWTLTMHGPDGTNYPNRSIFKEIIPFKKIVFEHFNPHFITTVLFESKGEETQVDWSMVFDTAEMREIVVKAHKAEEGLKENLAKLENHLSTQLRKSKA
ncbi:SRPBCC family protein [Ohtaekwangia sp.]|uniref:SRPBCC family protein n=1 Tax=Ohtaekwangia sp. TaxID=2066019 RepID=UPI002F9278AD